VEKEIYETKIEIESDLAAEMVRTQILPAAIEYQAKLSDNLITLKDLGVAAGTKGLTGELNKCGELIDALIEQVEVLETAETEVASIEALATLRGTVDALETTVDDDMWPLAKYREMLFMY
jgi:glutamine synthetase